MVFGASRELVVEDGDKPGANFVCKGGACQSRFDFVAAYVGTNILDQRFASREQHTPWQPSATRSPRPESTKSVKNLIDLVTMVQRDNFWYESDIKRWGMSGVDNGCSSAQRATALVKSQWPRQRYFSREPRPYLSKRSIGAFRGRVRAADYCRSLLLNLPKHLEIKNSQLNRTNEGYNFKQCLKLWSPFGALLGFVISAYCWWELKLSIHNDWQLWMYLLFVVLGLGLFGYSCNIFMDA